jgi:hypothetical protein
MGFEDLPEGGSWATLWHGYILCGDCSGIRKVAEDCPACKSPALLPKRHLVRLEGGTVATLLQHIQQRRNEFAHGQPAFRSHSVLGRS